MKKPLALAVGALMALTLALTAVGLTVTPASAHNDHGPFYRVSSWGYAGANLVDGYEWRGFVRDIRTDGGCVNLWTIDHRGVKLRRIARSCGGEVWGTAFGMHCNGVRMYHDNGSYRTLKFPDC